MEQQRRAKSCAAGLTARSPAVIETESEKIARDSAGLVKHMAQEAYAPLTSSDGTLEQKRRESTPNAGS